MFSVSSQHEDIPAPLPIGVIIWQKQKVSRRVHYEPLKWVMHTADPHLGLQLREKATRKSSKTKHRKRTGKYFRAKTKVSSSCLSYGLESPLSDSEGITFTLTLRVASMLCGVYLWPFQVQFPSCQPHSSFPHTVDPIDSRSSCHASMAKWY